MDTNSRRLFAVVVYHEYVEIEREPSKKSRKISHAKDDQSKANFAWV